MTLAHMPEFTPTKAAKAEDVEISGTISTDNAVQMTVSSEGAAHIMSLLTDLYSNPSLAVLREYSSNAYDSHVEAGQTRPIEVTLPTALSPAFVVTDYGVGMSPDTIRYIYSSYGASTKRNDFSQVGAFGLGCKSALTLTQSFTLVSRKDGVQTTAIISRGEDGVGMVNVVAEVPTSEPNGVTVNIPITDYRKFNQNVDEFFYGWKKGTVLVDGREPRSLFDAQYEESESKVFMYRFDSSYGARHGFDVIMGGVLYKVDINALSVDFNDHLSPQSIITGVIHSAVSLVSEIPIGAVDLTPSREAIRYSARTTKFLSELFVQMSAEIVGNISKKVSKAPDRASALNALREFEPLIRAYRSRNRVKITTPLKWKGEEIPITFTVTGVLCSLDKNTGSTYGRSSTTRIQDAAFNHNGVYGSNYDRERFFVVEADEEKVAKIRREFRYYLHKNCDNPYSAELYILAEKPTDPWIVDNSSYTFVTADVIFEDASEFRKENRAKRKATPVPDKIYYYTCVRKAEGGKAVEVDVIGHNDMAGKQIYYIEFDSSHVFEEAYKKSYPVANRLKCINAMWDQIGLDPKAIVVIIPRTWSLEALKKRLGSVQAKSLAAKARDYMDAHKPSDQYVVEVMSIFNEGYSGIANTLNDLQILTSRGHTFQDKEVNKLGQIVRDAKKQMQMVSTVESCFVRVAPSKSNLQTRDKIVERARSLTRKYPLLSIGKASRHEADLDMFAEHAMLYIKAVMKASKERTS